MKHIQIRATLCLGLIASLGSGCVSDNSFTQTPPNSASVTASKSSGTNDPTAPTVTSDPTGDNPPSFVASPTPDPSASSGIIDPIPSNPPAPGPSPSDPVILPSLPPDPGPSPSASVPSGGGGVPNNPGPSPSASVPAGGGGGGMPNPGPSPSMPSGGGGGQPGPSPSVPANPIPMPSFSPSPSPSVPSGGGGQPGPGPSSCSGDGVYVNVVEVVADLDCGKKVTIAENVGLVSMEAMSQDVLGALGDPELPAGQKVRELEVITSNGGSKVVQSCKVVCPLDVPSGSESGLKIFLVKPMTASQLSGMKLTFPWDISKEVVFRGNGVCNLHPEDHVNAVSAQ